jgi:putative transposase
MPSWRSNFNPDYLYFVTTKANSYLHVFEREAIRRLILDTLDTFRLRHWMKLYAFVIMPNHIHLISQFSEENPIDAVIRNFKHHSADRILRLLKAENDVETLHKLEVTRKDSSKIAYAVWESGYMAKDIMTIDFMQQKLEYIHANPCQAHWQLSETPEDYLWSSAKFYVTNESCIIPIDDVRDIF